MKKKQSSFRRREDKFIVIDNTYKELVNALEKHIPIFCYNNKDDISQIKTTYLDNSEFNIFKEYLAKREFRFKIRLRKYGYRKVFENNFWVDIKVKHCGTTFKRRFLLPEELYEKFIKYEDIYKEIKIANTGVPYLKKTYNLIAELMKINNLKPIITTQYDRTSFQKKSKRIRITIDKNIEHIALNKNKNKKKLSIIVFESKIVGKKSKWYKKMENNLSLLPQKRFSKYATGINSVYFPARGSYNFSTNFVEIEQIPKNIEKSLQLIKECFKFNEISLTEGENNGRIL